MRASDVIVGKEEEEEGKKKCLRIGDRLVNYIHVRRQGNVKMCAVFMSSPSSVGEGKPSHGNKLRMHFL